MSFEKIHTFLFSTLTLTDKGKVRFDDQNKSYDDSVKLKRTEMDPFRLG